jgi:ATP-dependent helicase HrpB
MERASLPVDAVLPAVLDALTTRGTAVLVAAPGAGKTTRVPPALLAAPWREGRTILVLEPRRLAARSAARRIADELGASVGGLVGWRMRRDTRVSAATRLTLVTEGVLTRLVQEDPALESVAAVVFDEFHERHLVADTGLALVLESRAVLRPDLRLLVMSATLDAEPVAALLGGAPVIRSEGRVFPVETRWSAPRAGQRLEGHVAGVVRTALEERDGDALVFLPGAAEIRRVQQVLAAGPLPPGTDVVPLFGALDGDAQDRAIAPAPAGRRKVVLATSIAETSLTIEGVRIVVDGGLARVPRYSPATGMTRLETIRVPRPSADQRRGRAGRVAPGICWRCWAEHDELALPQTAVPEIRQADLAPLALDLAVLGVRDPATLAWLDAPPAPAFAEARRLLERLGAIDAAGQLTAHGRAMADVGVHPRLAHLVLRGTARGEGALACDLAALLDERDILTRDAGPGRPPADLGLRLDALHGRDAAHRAALGLRVDAERVSLVRDQARVLRAAAGVRHDRRGDGRGASAAETADGAGDLLALAYPDRIARRRGEGRGRYVLSGGGGVTVAVDDPLAAHEWLVVAETDGRREDALVYAAAATDEAAIRGHHAALVETRAEVAWDEAAGRLVARECEWLGAILLRERPLRDVDPDQRTAALVDALLARGFARLPWNDAARRLRERLAFARQLEGDPWPDVSDAALEAARHDWLAPALAGARSLDEVARADLAEALLGLVPWAARRRLDVVAPTHLEVPTGSRLPVDYADPAAPALHVRLQELFGSADTPRVGDGRVPVTLHLLSPAHRPVQVTRDLAGFWRTSYFDVRKDLRGRYPRHPWPDDPMSAPPTRRAKPRGT